MEKFLYIPGHYEHRELSFSFFEAERPSIIEYCTGNGQGIGERAKQNPEYNWIAVEKRFERARQIWLLLHRERLPNLSVVCGEAELFTRYYAPLAMEVYINFPDPWPKRRHLKHRLIRADFLSELHRILPPGAPVTCATDDPPYAAEMQREFEKSPGWKLRFHLNEWPDYGRSFFKDLWLQKGRALHFLSYEKTI